MALWYSCRHLTTLKLLTDNLPVLLPLYREKSVLTKPYEEENDLAPDRKLEYDVKSLSARGYLRSQKPYSPPENVFDTVTKIFEKYSVTRGDILSDVSKYNVLKECSNHLNHCVPNSLLHKISSFDDVLNFYQTPVETVTPLDRTKNIDLPKNLHITYDYVRFHPETDTKFGGISAFPESSTIVTNLKAKKKYSGYRAKKSSL